MIIYKYPTENPTLIIILPKNFDENDKKVAVAKILKSDKEISIPNIDNLDFILEVTSGIILINKIEYGIGKENKSLLVKNTDNVLIKSLTEETNLQISYLKKEEPK